MSTRIDYKAIALESVHLLCSLGFSGLHPSRQRELWQKALDLDRRLHPDREPVTVWTEEDGDVDPPRRGPDSLSRPEAGTETTTNPGDPT